MDTLFATTKPHYINVKKVDVTEISHIHLIWLREPDLNRRPSGYEGWLVMTYSPAGPFPGVFAGGFRKTYPT